MGLRKFDDIWIVDLDTNQVSAALHPLRMSYWRTSFFSRERMQIIPPRHAEPCFDIPEIEYNVLSHHLKQALGSVSNDAEPTPSSETILNAKSPVNSPKALPSTAFNPFICGNDVDSIDVATRVAMVRFFNSPNILGNFNEHTRTLRLHPRAVVAFQYTSFIRSRPVKSAFVIRLAKTQVNHNSAGERLTRVRLHLGRGVLRRMVTVSGQRRIPPGSDRLPDERVTNVLRSRSFSRRLRPGAHRR